MKQSGIILLSTISMILILTLLLLTHMQQIALYTKALALQAKEDRNFYQLELKAKQLLLAKPPEKCLVISDDANGILKRLSTQGCPIQDGNLRYRYLMEDLGIWNCLQIKTQNQSLASHHKRLSLIQQAETGEISYLQMRLVLPESPLHCRGKVFFITPGISSWRFGRL
jgi:hypothetical protein